MGAPGGHGGADLGFAAAEVGGLGHLKLVSVVPPTVQSPAGFAHEATGQRKTPGLSPGVQVSSACRSSVLGHGSGTAERCTDDGNDGKDFHGWEMCWMSAMSPVQDLGVCSI